MYREMDIFVGIFTISDFLIIISTCGNSEKRKRKLEATLWSALLRALMSRIRGFRAFEGQCLRQSQKSVSKSRIGWNWESCRIALWRNFPSGVSRNSPLIIRALKLRTNFVQLRWQNILIRFPNLIYLALNLRRFFVFSTKLYEGDFSETCRTQGGTERT